MSSVASVPAVSDRNGRVCSAQYHFFPLRSPSAPIPVGLPSTILLRAGHTLSYYVLPKYANFQLGIGKSRWQIKLSINVEFSLGKKRKVLLFDQLNSSPPSLL